uniref:2-amino-4-hydroxy-6- hydroxymethyldihydropteridine diphosphokinase n=1 Tax=Thaumasiovibrio occultus TaxID=1891184 RepID=UPI000B35C64C|nr:2-amino-4-hydroxy-6-hydroxymethyldihydropteridine diphosphokinase [Thaumasiovibrio occultus]
MTIAYLSIGSNIERDYHLREAVKLLSHLDPKVRFSTVYEAEAVGYQGDNYLNCVAAIETSLDLDSLMTTLKNAERYYEQDDAQAQSGARARRLDLDVLLFGEQQCTEPCRLPRPDIFKFAFVLQPLSELAPELVIPGQNESLRALWQRLIQQPVMSDQVMWPIDFRF